MSKKALEIQVEGGLSHPFEYVDSSVLSCLLGGSAGSINMKKQHTSLFDRVRFAYVGLYRKFNFHDAAKLAYPYLTDFEIARLRVEINVLMKQERKKAKAAKSRSEENESVE